MLQAVPDNDLNDKEEQPVMYIALKGVQAGSKDEAD